LTLLFFAAVGGAAAAESKSPEWRFALGGSARHKLPPAQVLRHVFSADDLDFVATEHSAPLLALLVKQRRAIAISWLRLLKAEMLAAVAAHHRAARTSPDFRLRTEFPLALRLLQFAAVYLLLSALLRFYGPFAAKRLTLQLQRMSGRLSALQLSIAWPAPVPAAG
jgi:hypothetical protein